MAHVFDFPEVKPRLLYEIAADEIRKSIHSGAYAPGQRLNEVEIARALNLSRGPVREALRQLEQEGIVTSEPQKSVRVAKPSLRDIADAIALRETLETLASREIAENASDADIAALSSCVNAMKQAEAAGDMLAAIELDHEFHEKFISIGASSTVQRVWRSIVGQIRMFQAIGDTIYGQSRSVADSHLPIIEALQTRNAEKLREVTIAHIEENRSSLTSPS